MAAPLVVHVVVLFCVVCLCEGKRAPAVSEKLKLPLTPGRYNTRSQPMEGKLNVHIVPHTHDDVGWLKTVDEYFIGANNSIQAAGVQYVLDSVMLALAANPDRKFIYVEIAFFMRWWEQQTDDMQAQVKQFVTNGQLEFINGGWCMSDEAAPFYVDMVDQQTIGHQFLLNNFGPAAIPKTGWQIDPFGHSNAMATLYALMGMNSWFFGRIDYQDRANRQTLNTLELVMQPSASLGANVDIFTGVMPGYGPPSGFDFEIGNPSAPIQDDPRLEDVNVDYEVDLFVAQALTQAMNYTTGNIMYTMGSDFNYENANTWFKNLDKLIHYVNLDGRINVFYSTPTIYTLAKHAANATWTTKQDDWFPYADHPHAFWTGYFTSRPALKGYVRSSSNYLQTCRQIELQTAKRLADASSWGLWEAMGIAQHHDAVSGTEKQHVAYDYAKRLSVGAAECQEVVFNGMEAFMGLYGQAMEFMDCPLLNETTCPATTGTGNMSVVLYNPLGRMRTEAIRLPVQVSAMVGVFDSNGDAVVSQYVAIAGSSTEQEVVFEASLPAMGYATYFLVAGAGSEQKSQAEDESVGGVAGDTVIENELYSLTFDGVSGHLVTVQNKASNITTQVNQYLAWYNASMGNVSPSQNPGQASGAYIFRPNCTENTLTPCNPYPINTGNVAISVTQGALVQEVRQVFADWAVQTFRLYAGADFIEVEYTVGPVPIGDGLGKEIVTRWDTDLETEATFYTDTSGRDMQKRVRNYRPTWDIVVTDPVSGNYYPVNSVGMIRDETGAGGRQLSVMIDRSQGGASLADGSLELMVHRRLLYDDRRGVGEPLNETGIDGNGLVITATQRIVFETILDSPKPRHDNQDRLTFPVVPLFTPFTSIDSFVSSHRVAFSGLQTQLPPNVHLLSAYDNSYYGQADTMILRLAHSFEINEDAEYSQAVSVDLSTLFHNVTLGSCTEMSLTANQPLADVNRLQWNTYSAPQASRRVESDRDDVVVISPMEIRTFLCNYSLSS